MELMEFLKSPWPWYVSGPLIGLTVPLLLWLDNKSFGISSVFRHICALSLPKDRKPAFFQYNWRTEKWNLMFAAGLLAGGFIAGLLLKNQKPPVLTAQGEQVMASLGVTPQASLIPVELMDLSNPGVWFLLVISGLLVGFGTRYAGGCTSGHAITGLSTLQLPSLIATISFFAAGILSANFILPLIMKAIL